MTSWWLVTAALAGAAILVGWPARRLRQRRRMIISGRCAGDQRSVILAPSYAGRPSSSWHSADAAGGPPRRRTTATSAWRGMADRLFVSYPPWRTVLTVVVLTAVAGAVAGGPVAAIAVSAYGGLAARGMLRRRAGVLADRAHRRQLDELCALAADLRAGLPPSAATPLANGSGRPAELAHAAVRLAEQTGAPLADLVERIEADARAMDRGLAAAAAQAAGARATAWLLAGLPLGGIALGYGIGVDPLRILLHTPIGAACALGAIVLQLAGLAWAGRLAGGNARLDALGGGVAVPWGLGVGAAGAGGGTGRAA